jgi:hypothetical protein
MNPAIFPDLMHYYIQVEVAGNGKSKSNVCSPATQAQVLSASGALKFPRLSGQTNKWRMIDSGSVNGRQQEGATVIVARR